MKSYCGSETNTPREVTFKRFTLFSLSLIQSFFSTYLEFNIDTEQSLFWRIDSTLLALFSAAVALILGGEGRRHRCRFCEYSSHRWSHVKEHILTHTAERPYPCPQGCGRAFVSKSNLTSYTGERPLRQELHPQDQPEEIHECPHQGAPLPVPRVRQGLLQGLPPEAAHALG
ncbi:hypothetical protein CDAR_213651 [Caerostris darwini]|uniref:C2H2-type domain-containing protein n=1 Tax=Caerostris darwini TaxID=1538125 RepID=A0AAV4UQ70_9ARAC|nr:hypothetical protein CDAR_213651 [Caerostris darwini]